MAAEIETIHDAEANSAAGPDHLIVVLASIFSLVFVSSQIHYLPTSVHLFVHLLWAVPSTRFSDVAGCRLCLDRQYSLRPTGIAYLAH